MRHVPVAHNTNQQGLIILINIFASIVPGKSAGGLHLGQNIASFNDTPKNVTHLSSCTIYDFGCIQIWAKNQSISQIGIKNEYKGKLFDLIGIGSTLRDLETTLGKVIDNDEDNIIVNGLKGICFETEPWNRPSGKEIIEENLNVKITEIFVYVE